MDQNHYMTHVEWLIKYVKFELGLISQLNTNDVPNYVLIKSWGHFGIQKIVGQILSIQPS